MNSTTTAALLIGAVLFLAALLIVLNAPEWGTNIDGAITLATTVLGFALAIFGAVRTGFAVTNYAGVAVSEAVPSGAAAATGALLLIASRFIGV